MSWNAGADQLDNRGWYAGGITRKCTGIYARLTGVEGRITRLVGKT